MSDEQAAASGGEAVSYPTADSSPMSVEDAARSLTDARAKAYAKIPAESATEATAEPELAVEANAAPVEAHGEEPNEVEPEALPLIDPPSSWTKAEKERFQSLPRETQEYLHTREQERDRDFRRSQNEVAEERKAAKAEREAAEKARQDYLSKVPAIEDIQRYVQQGPFADIKTQDDADALAQNDPFRYLQWDAYQKRLAGAAAQAQQAQTLKAQESQSKRVSYEAEQNKLLVELVPEMADPKKASELRERAVKMLTDDLGLKNDQLSRWMQDDTGHEILSNASIQKLIADGLKLRDIQSATKAIAAKPVPAVQRPGQAKPASSGSVAQIQALEKQLSSATGDKAARLSAEIWRLEKKTAAR